MGSLTQRWYVRNMLLLCVVLLSVWTPRIGHATPHSDQNAAMHLLAQADVGRTPAPFYTMVGSVDVERRTVSLRQTLVWTNSTGMNQRVLPFRLYANLSDFAGQTSVTTAHIDGISSAFTYNHARTIVTLHAPVPIRPDAVVTITLQFQTTIPADMGKTKYGAFNDDGATLSFASAYPLLVQHRDGQWDIADPDTKGDLVNSPVALYDVTLTIPITHQLVSTGTTLTQTRTGDTRTVRVVSGLQRDYTFVVTTLPVQSLVYAGTRINVYAAEKLAVGSAQALRVAQHALGVFRAQFGQYPYNELDIVAVDAASFHGVEYPGLILMQEATIAKPSALDRIIVHEVAHQWFYNVVGNDVQADAWVDEAIATYAQVIYLRATSGEEAAQRELAVFQAQYDALIERELDAPIHKHMREYTLYTFNVLAYAKGALFYEALRTTVGAERFSQIIRTYVERHRYEVADGLSLRMVAEAQCACSLTTLYQTWIHP
jgi:hypothetical protein